MMKINNKLILREFRGKHYIINIENGDIMSIHEIGYNILKLISLGKNEDKIIDFIAPGTFDKENIKELLSPFYKKMINMKVLIRE